MIESDSLIQAEVLVAHYFPFVSTEGLTQEEFSEWFAKALWLEERNFELFKAAIVSALGGKK